MPIFSLRLSECDGNVKIGYSLHFSSVNYRFYSFGARIGKAGSPLRPFLKKKGSWALNLMRWV